MEEIEPSRLVFELFLIKKDMSALYISLKRILSFVIFVVIVALPQLNNHEYAQSTVISKFIIFSYSCVVILGVFLPYFVTSKVKTISISKLDIALFLFLSFILLNRYVFQINWGYSLRFLELLALSFFYIVFRILSLKNYPWFLLAVVISGIIQAVYGNLQLLGYYTSNHSGFKMTGSFFNPGPYAGFLTSVWAIALGTYLFRKEILLQVQSRINSNSKNLIKGLKYTFEYIPLVAVISIVLVLPAAQSRASWLAVILSSTILLELKYRVLKKYFNVYTVSRKVLLTLILSSVIGTGLFGIYHFKKGSSDGRLFIWKVTTEMIKEAPVFGHGFDRFKANYMNYQANYFAENGETTEIMVADNTYYAFNEFFQSFAENGAFGFLLLIVIGIVILKITVKEEYQTFLSISKAGLLAIAIFASFSYPMQILPVKLIMVVLLTFIASLDNRTLEFPFTKKRAFLCKTVVLLVGVFFLFKATNYTNKLEQGYKTWKNALSSYQYGDYNSAIEAYEPVYPIFQNEGEFLMNYGKTLSMTKDHTKAIEILEQAKLYLNTTIIETALGDSYRATKQYKKAEAAYQHAVNMIPSRFYPNYLLAKLYDESNQKEKALVKAKELLEKEVKINSTAIMEIHAEMKLLIEKYNVNVIPSLGH